MTNKVPVLVTGGAGYIGSHAVLALQDAGWPVVVLDNLVTGFRPGGAGSGRKDAGDRDHRRPDEPASDHISGNRLSRGRPEVAAR